MSKTRIFASSTCYDLAVLREGLREHLIALGHEPLLSEYPSFPVNPEENAIANCQKTIRNHTDLLILIIGGRRGALDEKSGKSVTNLEYDTARECGIPCFVFVNRSVHSFFTVWKKNPDADFSPTVDYPEVFGFIERIRNENRWIFQFETIAEIKEVLTVQFSTMLCELLLRSRKGTLDSLADFVDEPPKAQQLARDKPEYWEFLITAEMLASKLAKVRRDFDRVNRGLSHIPARPVGVKEFIDLTQAKITDLINISESLKKQMLEIQAAWGMPGVAGDLQTIKRNVDEFVELCQGLTHWEQDIISLLPPAKLKPLKATMKGWTEGILKEMERIPIELRKPFENGAKPSGPLHFSFTLGPLPVEPFLAESERIRQNFGEFLE